MKDAQDERAHSLDRDIVPSDQTLSIPTMAIKDLELLTAYVNQVKKTLMKPGKDYIIRADRQYTARSGFAKLAQGFSLSDDPAILTKELFDEPQTFKFRYKVGGRFKDGQVTTKVYCFNAMVKVIQLNTGRYATGEGSCTVEELHMMNKMGPRWYHDIQATAKTRAYNRAVSNFVGSADVSAEEIGIELESDTSQTPDRKEVDSQQSFPLPETFEIPTWDFAESLKAEGWGNVDNIFTTWVSNSGLSPEMFGIEVEPARAIVRTTVYLGESFGDVSRMLAKAGFKWRKKESRWVLMKPAGIE